MQQMMEEQMKKLDDPQELGKYLRGDKGKAAHVAFDPEKGPVFDPS